MARLLVVYNSKEWVVSARAKSVSTGTIAPMIPEEKE